MRARALAFVALACACLKCGRAVRSCLPSGRCTFEYASALPETIISKASPLSVSIVPVTDNFNVTRLNIAKIFSIYGTVQCSTLAVKVSFTGKTPCAIVNNGDAPSTTAIEGARFYNTFFDDSSDTPIIFQDRPYTGTFRSLSRCLSSFSGVSSLNGTWSFEVLTSTASTTWTAAVGQVGLAFEAPDNCTVYGTNETACKSRSQFCIWCGDNCTDNTAALCRRCNSLGAASCESASPRCHWCAVGGCRNKSVACLKCADISDRLECSKAPACVWCGKSCADNASECKPCTSLDSASCTSANSACKLVGSDCVPQALSCLESGRCSYVYTERSQHTIIPDNGNATIYSPVTDLFEITKVTATVNISHSNDQDLVIQLDGPSKLSCVLAFRVGQAGDNFIGTTFEDNATRSITSGAPPFTDSYKPYPGSLSVFKTENSIGLWMFVVSDVSKTDFGTFQYASLAFEAPDNCTVYNTNSTECIARSAFCKMCKNYCTPVSAACSTKAHSSSSSSSSLPSSSSVESRAISSWRTEQAAYTSSSVYQSSSDVAAPPEPALESAFLESRCSSSGTADRAPESAPLSSSSLPIVDEETSADASSYFSSAEQVYPKIVSSAHSKLELESSSVATSITSIDEESAVKDAAAENGVSAALVGGVVGIAGGLVVIILVVVGAVAMSRKKRKRSETWGARKYFSEEDSGMHHRGVEMHRTGGSSGLTTTTTTPPPLDPIYASPVSGSKFTMELLEGKRFRDFTRMIPAYYQMHHEDYTIKRLRKGLRPLVFLTKNVWAVTNQSLSERFETKQKYLRDALGRSDEEVEARVAFHGTSPDHIESICEKGLLRVGNPLNPSKATDVGYFGDPSHGIYVTRFVEYALQYSNVQILDGEKVVSPLDEGDVVKVLMFNAIPGKCHHVPTLAAGMMPMHGYDSHASPTFAEWFVFDEAQLLLTHVVELKAVVNTRTTANDGVGL